MSNREVSDDATIPDEARLWRRIPPGHFIPDHNLGRIRPSSAAFEDSPDGSPMSVVLADLVAESGRGPEHILHGHGGFALAEITAGLARTKSQGVVKDPQPDEPAHGLVIGKKTKSVKSALAKGSVWVVEPPVGAT